MESKQHVSNFQFFLEVLNLLPTAAIVIMIFLSSSISDDAYKPWMCWTGLILSVLPAAIKFMAHIKMNLIQILGFVAAFYWILAIIRG